MDESAGDRVQVAMVGCDGSREQAHAHLALRRTEGVRPDQQNDQNDSAEPELGPQDPIPQ